MKSVAVVVPLLLAACGSQDVSTSPQVPVRIVAGEAAQAAVAAGGLVQGDRADGPVRSVVGTGLRLTPFRVIGGQGLSESQCGVLIEGQRVMTLGAGDLDAYTCLRLVGVRALLPVRHGARVGLVYDAASRNTTLRTAALLIQDAGGRWTVDAGATTVFDNLPMKTWAAFTGALPREQ